MEEINKREPINWFKRFFYFFLNCNRNNYKKTLIEENGKEEKLSNETTVSNEKITDKINYDRDSNEKFGRLLQINFELLNEFIYSVGNQNQDEIKKNLLDDLACLILFIFDKCKHANRLIPKNINQVFRKFIESEVDLVASIDEGKIENIAEDKKSFDSSLNDFVNCLSFQDETNIAYLRMKFKSFHKNFLEYSKSVFRYTTHDESKKDENYVECSKILFDVGEYVDKVIFQK